MKRKVSLHVLIPLLLLTPALLRAQSHMTFNNLPLTGTIDEMAGKLMEQGFRHIKSDNNIIYMKGRHLNRMCEVVLLGTPLTQTVWKVYVALPKASTWLSLKNDFTLLQKQLEGQNGFAETIQTFQPPFLDGDGREMQGLMGGKCTWLTVWKKAQGTLLLEIQQSAKIGLSYEDGANLKVKHEEERQLSTSRP